MEKFTFFWRGPFSQWAHSPFMFNGIVYDTAEHFMMWSKAQLFKDYDTAEEILLADTPKEAKALGRKVRNYKNEIWEVVAPEFVYIGSSLKYNGSADLMQTLQNTKGTTLVEASPIDKIWGIGLSEDDPRAQKRETWLGQNLLGETLTRVREDYRRNISFSVNGF